MIIKRILTEDRVRSPEKGFSFIPHRFLREGFLQTLTREEILLYFFLILASDRNGVSFYSYESICNILALEPWEFLEARDGLIVKDLICFDKNIFQVLSLPCKPVVCKTASDLESDTVRETIINSLREGKNV